MGINKRNLKRTRKHIADINGSMINMGYYRGDFFATYSPECKSIGCIIGHATILDAKNVTDNFTNKKGIIFTEWSEDFFGIGRTSKLWRYLFGSYNPAIKEYHIYRMDYILAGNKAPTIIDECHYAYSYFNHYDDGYFIPIGMKI